ncbi:hypothetical protein JYT13_02065 [Mariprofundus ferrooxydans]|nr:hypothetical protein [Mariprofundus ferrooxydans]
MNASLKAEFEKLSSNQKVIYHLAGGPRSVVLQGLKALDEFHRESDVLVEGVIYDHTSQSFDVMYPLTQNDAYSCATLTLDDMLQTDGNYLDSNRPLKKLAECKKNIAFIEDLKGLAKEIKIKTQGKLL